MMRCFVRIFLWIPAITVLGSCANTPSVPSTSPAAKTSPPPITIPEQRSTTSNTTCPQVTATHAAFRNHAKSLPEVSGLVASALSPDLWWVHNDSGDKARVYAIDAKGLRAKVRLRKTKLEDAEDIAIWARLHRPPLLYLADTGDNNRRRQQVAIYRFPEPTVTTGQSGHAPKLKMGKPLLGHIQVRYDNGPQDVEAMFVDPTQGDIYLISKGRSGTNHVYQIAEPRFLGELQTAREVAHFRVGLVTGADITRDGSSILVRTYLSSWLFKRASGQSIAKALGQRPCMLESVEEPQGESIAWSPNGQSFYTLSEGHDEPMHWHTLTPTPATQH